MVETIDDIKRGNLSRAISWAEQESDFLLVRGSHLAFALHRQAQLLSSTITCPAQAY